MTGPLAQQSETKESMENISVQTRIWTHNLSVMSPVATWTTQPHVDDDDDDDDDDDIDDDDDDDIDDDDWTLVACIKNQHLTLIDWLL